MSRLNTFLFVAISPLLAAVLIPVQAQAHAGHVGELAGHSHLLGWGLMIGAGIAVAALARLGKKNGEGEEGDEVDADDGEAEGNAA